MRGRFSSPQGTKICGPQLAPVRRFTLAKIKRTKLIARDKMNIKILYMFVCMSFGVKSKNSLPSSKES